ncbi:tRNA (adenosine(37)-N6)-threonylcarbamoyltransferase complex ATPase subunit type 1 TsaE [Corticibacter populi]|nr:tRNA (adenosine(37)-N6)-threonylcarbamoyltransferase complex ATPase subunit type 1 TsaE [Corticibacter populi]
MPLPTGPADDGGPWLPLADEADTERLAQAFSAQAGTGLLDHAVLFLQGTLGAGKTTFVRHLLRALGVAGRIKSPTYALLESYALDRAPHTVYHFDLYRLEAPQEWLDAGLQDTVCGPGLKLIEWPQQAGNLLGQPDLELQLQTLPGHEQARQARLQAHTATGRALFENAMKFRP